MMQISLSSAQLQNLKTDLLLLPVLEGADVHDVAAALDGGVLRAVRDVQGKAGEVVLAYPGVASIGRVAFVGLGPAEKLDAEAVRLMAAAGAQAAAQCKAQRVACQVPEVNLDPQTLAEALVEGVVLGSYQYTVYKSKPPETPALEALTLVAPRAQRKAVEAGMHTGQIIAEATCFARDLVNRSPGDQTAVDLAEQAQDSAKAHGYQATVWGKAKIEAEGMGGLLAVNRGSEDPPTFTMLTWKPADAVNTQPVVLVGKGVVFDTGGLSLKPTKGSMDHMKCDMAGAAAVIGTLEAVARLALPVYVIALVPASDNRPGKRAYLPGEVVYMHDGTTVEVLNTDAEGRMLLADALSFAKRYDPALVIDLATLTGAQVVALGSLAAAIMTSETKDAGTRLGALQQAGQTSGDWVAPLPMYEAYGAMLKSDVADLKNIGGREAGSITAAKFLEHFTDYPWVHIDIAGPAFLDTATGYRPKGGTGFGVRLLVTLLRQYAENKTLLDEN